MSNCADVLCPSTSIAMALCPCSECVFARIPCTCPKGCDCLVCLVDSLSANPPPRADEDSDASFEAYEGRYDDDPNPYEGTYSED